MQTTDFNFHLPNTHIAQKPACPRDSARLLDVQQHGCKDRVVSDLPDLLQPGDVLVINNTKVIPARLMGRIGEASVEVMLHQYKPDGSWLVFAKPAKKCKQDSFIEFSDQLSATVLGREREFVHVQFNQTGDAFYEVLERDGQVPLPPYMAHHQNPDISDQESYQTIYAKEKGAVAAPTAGLHFTDGLFERLARKNVDVEQVTLHVGAGTFLPVKVEKVADHVMHAETCYLSNETADRLNTAKAQGRRIIAVGTTSLRLLESATDADGVVQPFAGQTDIFITPGYQFNCVDGLLTNFHLPKSTLFMLVCAFAGTDRMKQAYAHAIDHGYRFYSYGDACLLERNSSSRTLEK